MSEKQVQLNQPLSKIIVSFVYYAGLIRDTLEYTIEKPDYNVQFYKMKQNGIINEPKVNSPLHNFINANGEKGQEFLKRLEDFADLLYGEDSTILRLAQEGLRVDHAQHLAIYDAVLPLHEELLQIIALHVNHANQNKILENEIVELVAATERFYRSIVFTTLSIDIRKQFTEFNKIMNENKGQQSAASNFVQREISKLVEHFHKCKTYSKCNDALYIEALDAVEHMIEMMLGRRPLPEGQKFDDVYKNVDVHCRAFTVDAETKYKEIYEPCVKVLIASVKPAQEGPAA